MDVGTGTGKDFTTSICIEKYRTKEDRGDGFTSDIKTVDHYLITDMQRTRDLNTDLQVSWLADYITGLDPAPEISQDATRELHLALSLKAAIKRPVNMVIWSGGQEFRKVGRKYIMSKTRALMNIKSFIAMGRLQVADIPLRDELIKEMLSFSFVETDSGNFKIENTGSGHDDLFMGLAAGMVPLLYRRILERGDIWIPKSGADALWHGPQAVYTGAHVPAGCAHKNPDTPYEKLGNTIRKELVRFV